MGTYLIPAAFGELTNTTIQILQSPICDYADLPRNLDGSLAFVQNEAPAMVPINVNWFNDFGVNRVGHINLNSQGPAQFSKIRTLFIDNGACNFGINLVFPDSGVPIFIPAYSRGWYPAPTNALDFYLAA